VSSDIKLDAFSNSDDMLKEQLMCEPKRVGGCATAAVGERQRGSERHSPTAPSELQQKADYVTRQRKQKILNWILGLPLFHQRYGIGNHISDTIVKDWSSECSLSTSLSLDAKALLK
jgi:hypothetical protein